MAVAVVLADTDHGVTSGDDLVEVEVHVPGPMVWHGDHVDVQQRPHCRIVQEGCVARRPDVAGQQHRSPRTVDPQNQ